METCLSSSCTDDEDCGNHGDCRDALCSCDVGWFGQCCERSGDLEWNELWQLFRIVFAVALFAVSVCAGRQFVKGMMLRRSLGFRIIVLRLFKSPRNLSVALIVFATFLRGLWLAIDPFSFNRVMSRLSDRMLYNIVFALMYCVYCCVLLVWTGLYQGVTKKKELWSRIYRKSVVAMMCISFFLGLSFSACQGLRVKKNEFMIVAFLAICAAVVFILFGLLCFGLLLNKHIKSCSGKEEEDDVGPRQPSLRSNPPVDESECAELMPPRQSIPSLQVSPQPNRAAISGIIRSKTWEVSTHSESNLSSSTLSKNNQSSAWSVDSADASPTGVSSQWSEFDSVLVLPTFRKNPNKPPEKQRPEHENYRVELTTQDKIILRQIILLSLLSAIIGVGVVGLTVLIAISRSVQEWRTTLVLMYLISAMEFFAFVSVLFIFATTIKVKSKENLQFISEIAIKISRSPGHLVLPPQLQAISKRLHTYACASED